MNDSYSKRWSAVIFAHNEASHILCCLQSVISQSPERDFPIHVLANGCTDDTAQLVSEFAATHPGIELVNLDMADKANAWNHYVHHLAPDCACHFFIDADVVTGLGVFEKLYSALMAAPEATAAGALPGSGRSCAAWSQRMMSLGRLAGNCYALLGDLLAEVREQQLFIPVGLVGEDFFVTCMAKGRLGMDALNYPSPRIVFAPDALFTFDSLSPARPSHWLAYFKRLVRYQVREYQLAMLFTFMQGRTQHELPGDMQTLYGQAGQLPGYRWRGRMTPIDLLAVRQIRRGKA